MKLFGNIKQKLAHYGWDIAYGEYDDNILTEGLSDTKLHVVKNPYKNKWFADPFILDDNCQTMQLLVEEFDKAVGRGRIARITVDKSSSRIVECSIILDLPTHLSFPAIYRVDDELFVHPENSASGASYIYRYDRHSDKLVDRRLLIDEPIVDAIIRKDKDIYRLFATRVPEPNGCKLLEYTSDSLFGPYKYTAEHVFMNNSARMAGMFQRLKNGGIIRPSQDCFGGYGRAVIMYDSQYEICRLKPDTYKYAGIHTFNTFNNSFIVDLKRYDYPLFYRLTRYLK